MAQERPQSSDHGSAKGDESPSKPDAGAVNSYFRVFKYADGLSLTWICLALPAAIAAGVLLPLMNLIFGKFVTTFNDFATGNMSPARFRSQVSKYSLYFVYLFIGKFLLVYVHSVAISISAIRITRALRVDFLKHTLRQNIAYFDSSDAGSISTQATTNGNNVNHGISERLTLTTQMVSTFVTAFIVAFAVQWKLAFITASVMPASVVLTSICMAIDMKFEGRLISMRSRAGLVAEEVFSTIRTVHAFWLHPMLAKKYDDILAEEMKEGMKKSPILAVLLSTQFFCVFSGYSLAFWQGTRMYSTGEIKESGDVFTVILAVTLAAAAIMSIAPQIMTFSKAAAAAADFFRVIDRRSEIDSLSLAGIIPDRCIGNIELRNIQFAYPTRPDITVLENFCLSIPTRKTTALVGPSGSGKSTIIGLLERWYGQGKGTLLLDGIDIRNLNLRWLRTNMRLVQQEPVLFSGTVFENVAFGLYGTEKADLPIEEQRRLVAEACRSAYADEFIVNLPQKYDTQVGERAMMLSGGQKQRLAIARSIVSNPTVLLLDEATSALDPKAEKIVQQALNNVSANRTTMVIAHKLSTVRDADKIAVISKGTVIEQGTHEELIQAQGAYARLVRAQDLGQASSPQDTTKSIGESSRELSLVRTTTQDPTIAHEDSKVSKTGSMSYGFLRCLWIILGEQQGMWYHLLILAAASILAGLVYPAQAILFARVSKAFQLPYPKNKNEGNFYALMFFMVALDSLVAFAFIGWFSNIVVQKVSRRYRLEIFQNYLRQDMDFFDRKENATGSLASRLSEYPNSLLELLGFNLVLVLVNVVNMISSIILALIVGWKLALVAIFCCLPFLSFSGYLRIRLEVRLEEATAQRFSDSAALATEAVSAIRTVASLGLEHHIMDKYRECLHGVARRSIKALTWTMFWYALTQSITFPAMALGFWYGGRLMSTGEYSTNQFFIVFIGVIFSGEAAATYFSFTTSFTKAQFAMNHILWLRQLKPTIHEDPTQQSDEKTREGPVQVESQELEFSYPTRPNAKVLQRINIDAHPGHFIALVGASGCGKTTMIALLERFYDPTSGRITFDGRPITEICPRQYRSHIALVQQEPILYQGSIRDNIAMGRSTAPTAAQIESAAHQANIFDFVSSLPEGMATLVGSRGTQLSGGQRQRIAIARALVREPRWLLLDEATSALDTESEEVVLRALERAGEGRTTVAVAHRLSTIMGADCIFVFERGRVVETGTHGELLARRGVYYEMCLGQSLDRSVQ